MQNINICLLSILLAACPVASKASTVSYWKLDRLPGISPDMGLIDVRDSVGTASLDGGVWDSVSFKASKVRPSADCAFSGSPANPTVALPNGNVGSFFGEGESSYMRRDNLGNSFPLTKSWTLEGWFRPERSGRVTTFGRQPLWGSFQTRGWKCFLARNGQSWFIEVLAKNETSVIVSAALSGDLSDWCDWRHAALVYDSTDGNGRWDFYLDGILQKSAFNDVPPSGQTCDSRFCLAGDSSTGETFQGLVDCVRLSEGALSPQQFMCAADGTSASSVLALWPLNAENGAYFDGTDVSGNNWHLLSARETVYRASSSLERPVIFNPDVTAGFRGSRKKLLGSAAFCSQTEGKRSCLFCGDAPVLETLKSRNGWTVEFYVRRSSDVSAWEYLLGINDGVSYWGNDGRFCLSYRTNGFVLFEQMQTQNETGGFGIDDKAFPATVKDLAVGDWHHVALTFCVSAGNGVYELFVDGESCGTLSAALREEAKMGTSPLLYVGGRPWSDQSFKGELSSIRLSDVVLAPSEFLCAEKDIPEESPQTLAYWPLDGSGSSLSGEDLSGLENPISEFLNARPIERGDAAVRFLPVDDPIVAAGDFVKNLGAVSLDGVQAYLLSESVGSNLSRDASFTVEGWLRTRAESGTTDEEVVVGNFDPVARVGWKLSVVRVDGERRFRVFARGASGLSPLVDATFDGAVPTDWKHMALTYDVEASEGRWSLYVDRTKIGEAQGYYHPGEVGLGQTAFALGLKGVRQGLRALSGDYDVWRVSSGVLASDAFLPDGLNGGRGTLLLFR